MDLSVDPCQNFYQYACGGWIAKHPLTASASHVRRFDDPFYTMEPILRSIIEQDAVNKSGADDPAGALVGRYYQSCLDAPANVQARSAILTGLAAIGNIQSFDDLARQAAAQRQIGSGTFFSSGFATSVTDASRRIVFVDQGGVELERYHYVEPTEAPTLNSYRAHIAALASFFPSTSINADQVIQIETTLARAALDPDQRGDPRTLHHVMSVGDLAALAPTFSWGVYFQAAGLAGIETVDVTTPDYLVAVDGLLKSTPLSALKMYMAWQLIEDKASRLDDAILATEFVFWGEVINGLTVPAQRSWTCYNDTVRRLGMALSRPYIARHYPQGTTDDVGGMIGDLRSALSRRIVAASWLDPPTQDQAQLKLTAIADKVGYPAAWPSDDGLALQGSYVENDLEIDAWSSRAALAKLDQPVDHQLWSTSPITVNAFYSRIDNGITIPAGILQLPFFGAGYSAASNYGAIGAVIGHELTHGFDNAGRLFDASGVLRDWWSSDTGTAFGERAQCFVDQYSAYQALPGLAVDGALTLPENIADVGGLNVAYDAWAARGAHEGDRAGLDERQQFFVAYAQMNCQNARDQYIESLVNTDPHAPAPVRVNGTLANVPAAAEAFACAPGTPMAPAVPCAIW